MENLENKEIKSQEKKINLKVYIPLFIIILLVMLGCWFWYRDYMHYITTDDARVDADNVSLSSKIMGRIIKLNSNEGDSVTKGMLLAELDSSDLLAQKKQIIASKQQSVAAEAQSEAKYKYDQESIKVLQVGFEKTQEDFDRSKIQLSGDVITKEQFDHIKKAFELAKAQLDAARVQLDVSKAQINSAAASVENANAQIEVIMTQLKNTRLMAPIDGIVAKRWLIPGDVVQPGQSILTLTNNKKLWIIVYIEETKMADIHLNQQVKFSIDAFSGVVFTGKIFETGSTTASLFSLIPPNNASGNFTKITQRVPLKISIDGTSDHIPLFNFKILAGMSAEIKIIRD
jgi:membrane fusion protein (multidrug efflux system)